MYKNKRILGVIPARGGSKGLPGKNIRPLNGKPLIAWTVQAALKSKYLDETIVSTDSPKIAAVARKWGAAAPFLRPKELSTDKAKSIDVLVHALGFLKAQGEEYDYIIMLEPTSPLREASDIDRSIEMLINNKVGAVSIVGVSQVEAAHPAFDVVVNRRGLIAPYLGDFKKAGRRQDLSVLYFFEGTVYVSSVPELLKRKSFYHDKTLPYIVPRWKSLEIDDLLDLLCAETILKNLKKIKGAEK